MSKYTLHFKYQAVLHYLHIRSQQRTADHYGISRTHLRRWIRAYQEGGIGALEHPQSKTMTDHRKNPFIADKPDHEFLLRGGVFSKDWIDSYIAFKEEDVRRIRMAPHPLEFEMYYSL